MPDYGPIYEVVRRIPRGRVATYGMIATLAGYTRGARFVGLAMHNCRDRTVPCHRVVNASGGLAPGFLSQRARLEREGVRFLGQRVLRTARPRRSEPASGLFPPRPRVDLSRSLWSPPWPAERASSR